MFLTGPTPTPPAPTPVKVLRVVVENHDGTTSRWHLADLQAKHPDLLAPTEGA